MSDLKETTSDIIAWDEFLEQVSAKRENDNKLKTFESTTTFMNNLEQGKYPSMYGADSEHCVNDL